MINPRIISVFLYLSFTASIAMSGSIAAQELETQFILDSDPLDVPLVLEDISPLAGPTQLWVSGDRPGDGRLAQMTARPVQAAELIEDGQKIVLWRGFRGGTVGRFGAGELPLDQGSRYFCGPAANSRGHACFIDENADGRFDRVASAVPERGAKAYHLTIVAAPKDLPTALPYQIVPDPVRPAVPIVLSNCAKDYDRPRFIASSTVDRSAPFLPGGLEWHAKDSTLASCQRAQLLDGWPGATVPDGGFVARLGPLAFAVGPKKNPTMELLGPVHPDGLYRLEGGVLVSMGVGYTPNQAELVARKKFPAPFIVAEAGARVHDGPLAPGDVLASVPFRHAYRGRLAQGVTIRTLFGKRAVGAGTVLYGFPAQSSVSITQNGMPIGQTVDEDRYRKQRLELTWCAAVQQSVDPAKNPDPISRNGWSAACLPQSTMGTYTILTDLKPAFTVSSLRWAVDTASNDGVPPIVRDDKADFGQPLRIDYVFLGRTGDTVRLQENIYLGAELTSSRPESIYVESGPAAVTVAGGQLELGASQGNSIIVRVLRAPTPGAFALLSWDQTAFLRKRFEKMGLRLREDQPEAAGP